MPSCNTYHVVNIHLHSTQSTLLSDHLLASTVVLNEVKNVILQCDIMKWVHLYSQPSYCLTIQCHWSFEWLIIIYHASVQYDIILWGHATQYATVNPPTVWPLIVNPPTVWPFNSLPIQHLPMVDHASLQYDIMWWWGHATRYVTTVNPPTVRPFHSQPSHCLPVHPMIDHASLIMW